MLQFSPKGVNHILNKLLFWRSMKNTKNSSNGEKQNELCRKKVKWSKTNDLSENIITVAFVWEVNTYYIYMITKYTSSNYFVDWIRMETFAVLCRRNSSPQGNHFCFRVNYLRTFYESLAVICPPINIWFSLRDKPFYPFLQQQLIFYRIWF